MVFHFQKRWGRIVFLKAEVVFNFQKFEVLFHFEVVFNLKKNNEWGCLPFKKNNEWGCLPLKKNIEVFFYISSSWLSKTTNQLPRFPRTKLRSSFIWKQNWARFPIFIYKVACRESASYVASDRKSSETAGKSPS